MACTGSSAQNTITNIGDTRQVVVNVVDCDGEAVNVSAYDLTYTVKRSPSSVALITKTETDGITVAVDEVTILLDAADTAAMTNNNYHHELVIDDGTAFQTVMIGLHLFTHSSVSCCDALSATMNTVMFTRAYMLDFSSAQNSAYISIF